MTASQPAFYEVNPEFGEMTRDLLFGKIWEKPGLSKRDRSLVTVSVLAARYMTGQLPGHLRRALDNGLTKDELNHALEHIAFYAGWPAAANAYEAARDVFKERESE